VIQHFPLQEMLGASRANWLVLRFSILRQIEFWLKGTEIHARNALFQGVFCI